jgi:peptidoglycan/LPS O-acetylase OafA/YrhL
MKGQTLSKILKLNIFRIIGLSSYSIYLLHQPIFSFMENYLKGRLIQNNVLIKSFLVVVVIF